MRNVNYIIILALLFSFTATQSKANSIPIVNASFELPLVDPNAFPALPYVDGWTEIDIDTEGSTNTGVFPNTGTNSPDHIINTDGNQLAYIGSQHGNEIDQDLNSTYRTGYAYRMTIAVCISSLFPPSQVEPVDTIEFALYYRDPNDPNETIDIVTQTIQATGLISTQLKDFSVFLPTVASNSDWTGRKIGIAIRATGAAGGFWDLDNVRLTELTPISIPVVNASFELPEVDPNAFPALPYTEGWIENDLDTEGSANTGVFANTAPNNLDHIINADGRQLAFLGSANGNSFEQDLRNSYKAGCEYLLTAGVCISNIFPPSQVEPIDSIELALYYRDANDPNRTIDIASRTVEATGLFSTLLQDFSVNLPEVPYDANWTNKTIGIAIRAAGAAGGFWDLDSVRLTELMPTSIPVENYSFELPVIDLNAFQAVPDINAWNEIDVDTEGSTNTGVFGNTDNNNLDYIINADGNQLAFLGSQQGNAIEQDLSSSFKVGCSYRLTVGVCISDFFPPSQVEPVDTIELALYYHDANDPNMIIDIASKSVEAAGLLSTQLKDFSLYLPTVLPDAEWAGKTIGIAIHATGEAGGFWDLDNIRLGESLPEQDFKLAVKE